jgi:CBS domain
MDWSVRIAGLPMQILAGRLGWSLPQFPRWVVPVGPWARWMQRAPSKPASNNPTANSVFALVEMFTRYQFHLIPVVDEHDRLLGVVHYRDIMKGLIARARG